MPFSNHFLTPKITWRDAPVQTLSSAINSRAINPPSIEGRGAEGYPLETHLKNHAHVNSRYFWPCMKSIFLASC
jgi:hypothetical protein